MVDLRVHKEAVSSLAHFFGQWKNGTMGIVTADKFDKTKEQNIENYNKLKVFIRNKGYGYIPVGGVYYYKDPVTGVGGQKGIENAFWIPNVTRDDIHAWANYKEWPQETYIYGENGKSWLFHSPDNAVMGEGIINSDLKPGVGKPEKDETWGEQTKFKTQFNPEKEDHSIWKKRPFQLGNPPEEIAEAGRILTFRK